MVDVTEELTRKVAHLARLALTDAEVTLYTAQMKNTLGYVDLIAEVDVAGVEPMFHPLQMPTPMREDVVVPSPKSADGKPKTISHAPEVLYDGFKVPPII